MAQLVKHGTQKKNWFKRSPLVIALAVIIGLTTIMAFVLPGNVNRHQSSAIHSIPPSSVALSTDQCAILSSSQWTPIGTWKLTVSFLTGPRKGQSEASVMTFLPGGGLTATFPGSRPVLPPAIDGRWCMTGFNAFHYQFKEPLIMKGDTLILYVATSINAYITSKTTFDAGGIGVAYSALTGKPVPGQYNVTVTSASAS